MAKNKIEVKIKEVPKNVLHLTQHFGEGSLGKTKFDAKLAIPTMSMIVTVEKKEYIVNSGDLISAMVDYHKANNK